MNDELTAAESWTYEHPNEEGSVYLKRLQVLKKKERDLLSRQAAWQTAQEKVRAYKNSIRRYKASATAPLYDHIAQDKLNSIIVECDAGTQWLKDLEKIHSAQQKYETPADLTELRMKASKLASTSAKILSEPRPKLPDPPKEQDDKENVASDNPDASSGQGDAPKSRSLWKWVATGGVTIIALVAAPILGGFGEPYGVPTPLNMISLWQGREINYDTIVDEAIIDESIADEAVIDEVIVNEVIFDDSLRDQEM